MSTLSIIGTKVRTDAEGRYSLNDLHKAAVKAGANKRTKEPGKFLSSSQTVELLTELTTQNPGSLPADKKEGRNGGTYACKELVYAYAMWISSKFHLQVIQAYDALANGEIEKAKAIATRQQVKDEYIPMTDAVKQLKEMEGGQAKHYHFTNENNLIYRILTGMTAKEFKAENGVESVRDNLTPVEQKCLLSMQRANTTLIEMGMDYQDRKVELENLYQRLWLDKLTEENIRLEA